MIFLSDSTNKNRNLFEKKFIEHEIKQSELIYYMDKQNYIIEQKGELKTLFYPPKTAISNIIEITQALNIDIALNYECYIEYNSIPTSKFYVLSYQDSIR